MSEGVKGPIGPGPCPVGEDGPPGEHGVEEEKWPDYGKMNQYEKLDFFNGLAKEIEVLNKILVEQYEKAVRAKIMLDECHVGSDTIMKLLRETTAQHEKLRTMLNEKKG